MFDQHRVRQVVVCAFMLVVVSVLIRATGDPVDPGTRGGVPGAGGKIASLTLKEAKFFDSGLDSFEEVSSATGSVAGTEPGLGPRFNLNSCAGCHAHPAVGGSSPAVNPQVSVGPPGQVSVLIGLNIISPTGPVREVRFSTDGGVHDLFTIAGLPGAPAACNNILQPDFTSNFDLLRFRIPTPVFGAGLIEAIPDATIAANVVSGKAFGVTGHENRNGNDGTITRFGWKAQNKSLAIFSGEAYNVEQGITNELFPDERGEAGVQDAAACHQAVTSPQDTVSYELTQPQKVIEDVSNFSNFMRFLAAPVQVSSYPGASAAQIIGGEAAFNKAGCNICHKKSMQTGNHANAALRNKAVNLFSDLLVHDIGTGDGIAQGTASGAEFRTAPLWGVGQRLFFLHGGSASNLVDAINAHGGEASRVTNNFKGISTGADAPFNLTPTEQQNLVLFLRSL